MASMAAVSGAGALAVPGAVHALAVSSARAAVPGASSWGRAIEVPGLGALNKGGKADVFSVSCGAAGNCAAGGTYRDSRHHRQGFVAVERHGRWGTATEVPGLATLNKGRQADVRSVSCASASSCAAGGSYLDGDGDDQGFVAAERNGHWGTAIEMPDESRFGDLEP